MRCLIDTHALIWFAADDPQLSARAREIFLDRENELFVSAATIWEMAIKVSVGKLSIGSSVEQLVQGAVQQGIRTLAVTATHASMVVRMPFHHRDPFDRMLVAQAMHERLDVLSCDALLDAYNVTRVWE